jgi:hypothetical protein
MRGYILEEAKIDLQPDEKTQIPDLSAHHR